ncbi:MAG: tyrosine-type recombinase/integrase [Acaryochloris sp. SU_5_25]|nr:tyrosine-type recombinase/integrase [Acaryochloris sp. SU_5_25]
MILTVGSPVQRWFDDEIVINFLAAKGARSHHTRENYDRDIQNFRGYLSLEFDAGPDETLRQVDVAHVAEYHAHLVEGVLLGELSERTVNRRMAAVSSLFRWCLKPAHRKYTGILHNPVDVERYRVESSLAERVLSEDQVLKLLEISANPPNRRFKHPQRNAALCRFLYSSGCRVSEVVILKWKHFSIAGGGQVITQITGKGGKRRYVRLSAETWKALKEMDVPQGKNDPVFPNLVTSEPMTRDGIAKIVKRCGKLIDVPNLSPHIFRHSHATHAVRRGVPLDLVKDTLGHSSIATTQIYLKANPSDSSGLHLVV